MKYEGGTDGDGFTGLFFTIPQGEICIFHPAPGDLPEVDVDCQKGFCNGSISDLIAIKRAVKAAMVEYSRVTGWCDRFCFCADDRDGNAQGRRKIIARLLPDLVYTGDYS